MPFHTVGCFLSRILSEFLKWFNQILVFHIEIYMAETHSRFVNINNYKTNMAETIG